jgi:ADP-heptose:LPS heptosyltransferase
LPVVSLFGPTTPEWTTTYNLPETILQVPLDCRPCFASQCPLQHHACMEGIRIESVFQAACVRIESTSLWTLPTPQDLRVPEAA